MYIDNINKALYKNNTTVKLLSEAIQPELDEAMRKLEQTFHDHSIPTMSDERLETWEKVFRLWTDVDLDTRQERLERLKKHWSKRYPLDYAWLQRTLGDILGDEVFYTSLDVQRLELMIEFSVPSVADTKFREVARQLMTSLPANILLSLIRLIGPYDFTDAKLKKIGVVNHDVVHETIPRKTVVYHPTEGSIKQIGVVNHDVVHETIPRKTVVYHPTEGSIKQIGVFTHKVVHESVPKPFPYELLAERS